MEFYVIFAGLQAFLPNILACRFLLYTEKRLWEKGAIPPRGEILYLEDYAFFKWGDEVAVTVMDSAIAVVLVAGGFPPLLVVIICAGAVLFWTAAWHWRWLRRDRNFDSLYPRPRQVSRLGRLHLPYLFIQYFAGLLGLWVLLASLGRVQLLVTIWGIIGVAAAICYFYTLLWLDWRAGRLVL